MAHKITGDDILAIARSNPDSPHYRDSAVTPAVQSDKIAKAVREYDARQAQRGTKVTRDGMTFDSGDEMARYDMLLTWQQAGLIEGLRVHPDATVRVLDGFIHPSVGKVRARNWEFDFVYQQRQAPGLLVYEDFKGRPGDAWKAMYAFRLYFLRDLHVFVNHDKSGWYWPFDQR